MEVIFHHFLSYRLRFIQLTERIRRLITTEQEFLLKVELTLDASSECVWSFVDYGFVREYNHVSVRIFFEAVHRHSRLGSDTV